MKIKAVTNHGQKRWRVCWRSAGKEFRRLFKTKEDADRQMITLQREKLQLGEALADLSAMDKVRMWTAWQKLAEHGGTIEEAIDLWIKHRQARPTLEAPTVADLVAGMLKAKEAAGARPRYIKQLAWSLKRFLERFAAAKADMVTPGQLEDWIQSFTFAPVTKRGFLTDVRTLFSFARKRGWVTHNPAESVEWPRIDEKPVEIFTVDECRRLLHAALKVEPESLAYLAIGLFAGLRPSEIDRLKWTDIDGDYISINATKVRTRKRRVVRITPALRSWLAAGQRDGEYVRPINYVRMWRRAVKESGVQWKHDVLRHTFASYHLAACQDPAKTAFELGHFNSEMLFRHYRERVKPDQAEAFWGLYPIVAIPNQQDSQ